MTDKVIPIHSQRPPENVLFTLAVTARLLYQDENVRLVRVDYTSSGGQWSEHQLVHMNG